ncbi:MADS-box transcription factor CDM77 [Artemisia annua]|uniref:MADS-box transcription factor CDM77 n=1 Tax=Artemisia annua TaxID=35608 RepID=A0A2U1QJV3_ARTAN|nr:MADS-box transcription factor CDM77 [Artemisia annua]
MLKTLERYEKCSFGPPEQRKPAKEDLQEQSSYQEYMRLKERYDALKQLERNYYGEEIDNLSTNELESLERQLHSSLKQIRTIRTQSLVDKLYEQQKMEHHLYESNKTLRLKLNLSCSQLEEESQAEALQWEAHAHANGMIYGHPQHQLSQTTRDAFYHPTGCETTLQIGYQTDMSAATSTSMNHQMQGWPA